jgi:hypothetical protein
MVRRKPLETTMLRPLLLAGLALSVAACNRSDEGTSVTINADGGNVMGAIDGETGEMKIDIPGLKGAVTLPKIKLDSGDFDLNGVRLYPGSSITNVSVTGDGKEAGGLRVRFASPATPDVVRGWFAERLAKVPGDRGRREPGRHDRREQAVPARAGPRRCGEGERDGGDRRIAERLAKPDGGAYMQRSPIWTPPSCSIPPPPRSRPSASPCRRAIPTASPRRSAGRSNAMALRSSPITASRRT